MNHAGEIAALAVALCWTISAIALEIASKRGGSLSVNFIRLILSFAMISVFTLLVRGKLMPFDASAHQWLWLLLSGVVGFVIGDYFLFKAFISIGSRLSMVVMTTAPLLASLGGFLFLNENLKFLQIVAMSITLLGVVLAIYSRRTSNQAAHWSTKGVLFGFGGALGQAGGLLLSKYGMEQYDAFAATQIRLIAGIVGFFILLVMMRKVKESFNSFNDRKAISGITLGAFFGSFLGVGLSLYAIQRTSTGVASAIMSIVPILIIVPSVFVLKQKVKFIEIIGAILSVIGVILFFI